MPTYEYKCDACGAAFERFQPITAQPVKRCPECGKAKVRRLISTGAGLIFKGSGFYITDYRDKSYSDKAKAESGAGGGGEGEGGGETKSDAKGDAAKTDTAKTEAKSAAADAKPAATPAKSESKPSKSESKSPPKKKQ